MVLQDASGLILSDNVLNEDAPGNSTLDSASVRVPRL